MENRFDDLTKALAEGIPRRQALRRLAGLFGGALLGALTFSGLAGADQGGCPQGTVRCPNASPKLCCPTLAQCCVTINKGTQRPICCPAGYSCFYSGINKFCCPSGFPC
jgi:hypothetical protein